nr:hypothetical protein HEP87_02440 [Streptomyces sp. S1D4-11]
MRFSMPVIAPRAFTRTDPDIPVPRRVRSVAVSWADTDPFASYRPCAVAGLAVAAGVVGQPIAVQGLPAWGAGPSATVAVLPGMATESTATEPEVDRRAAVSVGGLSAAV